MYMSSLRGGTVGIDDRHSYAFRPREHIFFLRLYKEDVMTPSTKSVSVPAGYHSITPVLTVKNAEKSIGFYKRAFGPEEPMRFLGAQDRGCDHHAG